MDTKYLEVEATERYNIKIQTNKTIRIPNKSNSNGRSNKCFYSYFVEKPLISFYGITTL